MPDVLVLDASVLCKLLRQEPESPAVEAAIRRHLDQGGVVETHSIASIEVITCIRKAVVAKEGTAAGFRAAWSDLQGLVRFRDTREWDALLALATATGLTGPDCAYLELAKGAALMTFDAKQAGGAKAAGVKLAAP